MNEQSSLSLIDCFGDLPDLRVQVRCGHKLVDMIVIAICGGICGCLVTIDAMGCQTKIAQTIREEQADYLLQVKDNQKNLRQDLEDWFVYGDKCEFAKMQMGYHETVSKTSGRLKTAYIGSWMSPLRRINRVFAKITVRKTWLFYVI